MEPLPGVPQQQQLYQEHRPPTQAVPRNVPPEPPPQHAAAGLQAEPTQAVPRNVPPEPPPQHAAAGLQAEPKGLQEPKKAVPRNVPPEPPPQHAAAGLQAEPLCNFNYITRQGNKRTKGANVVCAQTASGCMFHRKPPEPPPSDADAASGNLLFV